MFAALVVSPHAAAHARLTKSVPAAGAELSTAPASLVLSFSEAPERSFCTVTVADDTGAVREIRDFLGGEAPEVLIAPLKWTLRPGLQRVRYRVLSVDGHVVEGGFDFRLAAPPAH